MKFKLEELTTFHLLLVRYQKKSMYILHEYASKGSIEGMKWTLELGFLCDRRAVFEALRTGHFEAVEWLRENGCPE